MNATINQLLATSLALSLSWTLAGVAMAQSTGASTEGNPQSGVSSSSGAGGAGPSTGKSGSARSRAGTSGSATTGNTGAGTGSVPSMGAGEVSVGASDPASADPKRKSPVAKGAPVPGSVSGNTHRR